MNRYFPKWLSVMMIAALAIPLFIIPVGAAPAADAPVGDVTTASGAAAYKLSPSLKAAVAAAAPTDDINLVVYALQGTDLSPYMTKLIARKYVMPNGIQAYFGTAKAGQVEKIASLAQVVAVKEMRYEGDLPRPPDRRAGARYPGIAGPLGCAEGCRSGGDCDQTHRQSRRCWLVRRAGYP